MGLYNQPFTSACLDVCRSLPYYVQNRQIFLYFSCLIFNKIHNHLNIRLVDVDEFSLPSAGGYPPDGSWVLIHILNNGLCPVLRRAGERPRSQSRSASVLRLSHRLDRTIVNVHRVNITFVQNSDHYTLYGDGIRIMKREGGGEAMWEWIPAR